MMKDIKIHDEGQQESMMKDIKIHDEGHQDP
jgi:hypothetical protein